MASNNKALRHIAMEYLFDGMLLPENIFNHSGELLLLAKGAVLTENNIKQIKKHNDYQLNISVCEETYSTLIQHGLKAGSTLEQGYLEEQVGYTQMKNATADMLSGIKESGAISADDTTPITDDMLSKLYDIKPSLIFQCISGPAPIGEYLRRHSVNVALLNGLMGKWLGLSEGDIALLVLSGLVHDIGKIKIPTEVLDAPRRLSVCEFEVIKMHPLYSYELLCNDGRFHPAVKAAARSHHERVNGDGYPAKLTLDQISLFAKISAVSDIYDAMISKRCYKEADPPFLVLAKLANQQFSGLDMGLVKLFIEHMPVELVGEPVLLSDGSIGIIKHLVQGDLAHPLVEVNGQVEKMDNNLYCVRMIFE